MAGELEMMTREFFAALDRKDFDQLLALSSDDVQIVDEISGAWLRGPQPIAAYLHQLAEEVANIDSTPSDIHAAEIDGIGIVTFVLEQRYEQRGQTVQITAPTTIVARRTPDGWRWLLFHSVPISTEQ